MEYNIKQFKLGYYHNRGIYNCTECGRRIKELDRIVSKRTSSNLDDNTEIYCKECAVDLIIIVEKDD